MVGAIRISVCVAVEDDAQDLSGCLASCENLADEFVVLDRRATPREPAQPHLRQLPVAADDPRGAAELAEQSTNGDWILLLSADETVSAALRRKILGLIEHGRILEFRAFEIRRRHWVCGRPMGSMNLHPDFPTRLFARQIPVPDGEFRPQKPMGRLEQPIEHTVVSRIDTWLRRRERHFRSTGVAPTGGLRMALRPPARFLQEFVARGGWRDRRSGLVWAGLQASEEFLATFYRWQRELTDEPVSRPGSS